MLPKKIVLENFGPFVHETVDFTRLNELPLFLIGGKTGAGKTTIFDGITYALFGDASGGIRSVNEFRSTFADNHEPTRVLFEFEHQGRLYQIERSPKQRLRKKRGEGFTEKAPKVQFTVYDEGKEVRAYTKEKVVSEEIYELLHLNKKQFRQIVMLPQGEFRNFLVAPSSEKEILLRNLFGTESYRAFTEDLKQQKQMLESECQQATQKIQQCLDQLSFERGATIAESITLVQVALTASRQNLAEQQQALALEKRQLKEKRTQVATAEKLAEKFEAKAQAQQELAALKEQEPLIQQLEAQVAEGKKLERLKPLYDNLQQATATTDDLRTQQTALQAELSKTMELWAHWERADAELTAKSDDWQQKEQERQQLTQLLPLVKQQASLRQQQTELLAQQQEHHKQLRRLEQNQQLGEKNRRLLQQEVATRPVWQERLYTEKGFFQRLEQLKAEADQIEQVKEIESDQQIQLAVLIEQIAASSNQLIAKETEYKNAKSRWAALEIARLSQELVPGEPCPICGSLDHPNPASVVEVEGQELQQLQLKLERLEQAKNRLEITKVAAQKQADALQQRFDQQQEARYQRQKSFSLAVLAFCEQLAQFYSQSEQIPDLDRLERFLTEKQTETQLRLQQLTETATELAHQDEQQAKDQQQQAELQANYQARLNALSELKGKLTAITEQLGEVKEAPLQARLQELTNELAEHQQQVTEHQQQGQTLEHEKIRQQAELKQLEKQLITTQMEQQKCQTLLQEKAAASQVSLEQLATYQPVELADSEAKLQKFANRYAIAKDRFAQLQRELVDQNMPDVPQLQVQLAEASEAYEQSQQLVIRQEAQLTEQEKLVTQITDLQAENEHQLATLAELTQLFQTFNGDNPQKISLERYVLQWYLMEVLQSANHQLAELTNGRYQFELNQQTGSYKGQTGLEINIFDDNAGASRSAHSLSGGESFIAALALALGLAEVIQAQAGGVAIDALFIDEGFGSLDEEALQMAIDALAGIENKGRMIGIISHVKELKEQIPQQILVNTSGTGQSTIDYRLEGWSEVR